MSISARIPSLDQFARFLWAAALLALPVTSFRYFPAGGGTYERPLAIYPLLLLMPVLFIQFLRSKATFPRRDIWTSLAAFILAALVASLIGMLFAPLSLRGQDVLGRSLRAWATVVIGLVFFVAAVWMNRNEAELRFSVQWLFAGFILDILWSGLQGATFYLHLFPKPLVTHWQRLFSLRELIRTDRISGLAYEPSWLAGQISTLYLPWLFAWLLTRVQMTRFKWLELALLIFAVVLLLATFSRGGLLTVAATVVLTFLLVGRQQIVAGWRWFITGFHRSRELIWRLGLILAIVAAGAGALYFLSRKGYISRLWHTQASSVTDFLVQNSAGARVAYIAGALGAYQQHPWTGVGLGASGFSIYGNLPDWAFTTIPEIARQLDPSSMLYPNPKNLYIRLLAETGLIGFFLYLAFQFSILGDAFRALQGRSSLLRYLGMAAVFTWLALIFYNMTQDSLAIPNLWINFGILVGVVGGSSL